MIIKSIQIKNFRSIVNEHIDASNLTLFVGNNDAGKSNIIKALNLFLMDKQISILGLILIWIIHK